MIIDTTYLLPLARIKVKTDLLRAIAEDRLRDKVDFSDLKISLISIFELQAKASKLGIPPKYVCEAVNTIFKVFNVVPYYRENIIEVSHELYKELHDYIDSIILATAITLDEHLVTEDTIIHSVKDKIEKQYNTKILRYIDLIK